MSRTAATHPELKFELRRLLVLYWKALDRSDKKAATRYFRLIGGLEVLARGR